MVFRIILGLCIFLPVQAAEYPPLEELMTDEEIQETGLHKLDNEERKAFRRWLQIFVERDAEFVKRRYREKLSENRRNSEKSIAEYENEPRTDTAITSNIVGEFSGWEGKARFELANGQVWEHRRKHTLFRHRPLDNPRVIIDKNFLGFFIMEIPEANVKVPVKRIR